MKFQTGSVFGNRYTLGELIAVGGMGEVWQATDRVLGRTVAMKLLSPSLADQPGFERRFREEARNTAMLSHPNIAAVYDYGEDAGASWLVMELVEGKPLSQIIKEDGTIAPRRTAAIIAQAASALQAAHDAGVIHRDVKPANILIRRDGEAKLTDFGIARATDSAPITRTGEVMGTAQYISPEQATGKPASPASDLYSLGVVAHEMLTGTRPFDEGSPVATAMAHIHNSPPPLPHSVGQPLAGVVVACMAKDPQQRPESAAMVASALRGGPEAAAFATTEVVPRAGDATQRMGSTATMVQPAGQMPPPGYPPPDRRQPYGPGYSPTGPMPQQQQRRGLNPWLWIVPLLILLGIGGYLLAQTGLFGGSATPQESPTTPVTQSPTQTSATTPTTVQLDSAEYRGMTVEQAQARLRELGFTRTTVNRTSDDEVDADRVISINPSEEVEPGQVITLNVSTGPANQEPTTPSTPDQPTTSEEPTEPDTPTEESPTPEESPTSQEAPSQQETEPGRTDGAAEPGSQQAAERGDAQAALPQAGNNGNPAQGQRDSDDQEGAQAHFRGTGRSADEPQDEGTVTR